MSNIEHYIKSNENTIERDCIAVKPQQYGTFVISVCIETATEQKRKQNLREEKNFSAYTRVVAHYGNRIYWMRRRLMVNVYALHNSRTKHQCLLSRNAISNSVPENYSEAFVWGTQSQNRAELFPHQISHN